MDINEALPLALEWAALWKPGQKCLSPRKPVDSNDEFSDVYCGACKEVFGCGDHDIPCPPLTDALAMALLRVVNAQGFCFSCDNDGQTEIYAIDKREKRAVMIWHADPAEAIVLAVAALAQVQAEKEHPR